MVRYFCGTSIHAMSMISHEIIWWDISVVQVSVLCQWYLTKLVLDFKLSLSQSVIYRFLDVMWCDVMWCDVMWCDGTSIHAMSMISHEISWWDISVVQVSMLCQWYLTKLVGEIFLGTDDACDKSESVIDPVCPVSPVSPVSLAHLWVDFRVI